MLHAAGLLILAVAWFAADLGGGLLITAGLVWLGRKLFGRRVR